MRFPRLNEPLRPRPRRKPEGGQALVLVAVLLSVIGGMSALAVDLGSYSTERRDLQNAADAIALAASQDLPSVDAATTAANSWKTKNKVASSTMTVTVTQQSLPSVPNPIVKITLTHSHHFTFAALFGMSSKNVSATATAIKTSPGGSGTGLIPLSVTQATISGVTPGQSVVLKYDSNHPVNGNFGAIRIDGNGANVYRDSYKYGSSTGLCATGVTGCSYPSTVNTETGNMVGPTQTATDYRINNTDLACDTWAEAVIVSGGKEMLNPTCNPFVKGGNPNSLRIIVIPIINSLCNGSCDVTINSFALFFLEGYGAGGCTGNDCEIKGRWINSNTNYGANVGVFNPDTLAHFVKLTQ